MTAVALRGLLSRKLRTALTAIAILLGVSMISGTYILTDTINKSFSDIFHTADAKIDAVVSTKAPVSSNFGLPPSLPARVLTVVSHTPGVAAAGGIIADTAQLFDMHGNALSASGGAPSLLFSLPLQRFRVSTLVAGRWPHGLEVTIDTDTFKKRHLRLGEDIMLAAGSEKARRVTVVGESKFGSAGSLGGAAVINMDLSAAQRVTGKIGKYDSIDIAAAPGISAREIAARVRTRIPPSLRSTVEVKTGQQNADDSAKQIGNALSFLTIALLAFGGIAVFVGAFIIFNTFSITVAQRAREFALLRTIGATRRQVLLSVILEALLLGIVASLVGLLLGFGIARGLNGLFVAFGIDLPNTGLVVQTRTIVVALLVGTVVTLVSGIMPAVKATRVPPIAALREGAQLPKGRFSRFTPYIAGLITLLGIGLLANGIFANISSTTQRLSLIGFGAVVLFLGVAMLSPQLVGPLAGIIGWPIERLTNITGRLARENTVRNPSRTAITAAALMIGLALVGFVTIFAAEIVKTADDTISRNFVGNYTISNQGQNLIPSAIAREVARIPGIRTVTAVRGDSGKITGIGIVNVNGVEPRTLGALYTFDWKVGSSDTLRSMGSHDAVVDDQFAADHRTIIGSLLRIATPAGRVDTFRVRGIYKSTVFFPNVCIPYSTFGADWQQQRKASIILVGTVPGADLKAVQARITARLKSSYPTAQVQSTAEVKAQQQQSVNKLLALIYMLLAMSVIVSLFGIINTLILSVYERTREIGMLRAIGTTRAQIRWMIRWESVITSVIGAVLGLVLGTILAMLVTSGLSSQGIERALPVGQLLLWVVFSILFGIIAAAFPARRAARLDVLQAIAYE